MSDATRTQARERTQYRRALEALRNGVPNRDAVRVLGCDQDEAVSRFDMLLAQLRNSVVDGEKTPGVLIEGNFGTGKSHLLEHLQSRALAQNFVCSRVVVSKETPLYDVGKLFKAAVEAAEVPGLTGPAVSEIALKMNVNSPGYVELYRWAHQEDSGLSTLFPATLLLYERLRSDPELAEKITNFWSGERLPIADVRAGLRQVGELASYPVKAVTLRQLALERFTFLSRLIRGAGFAGWVLLIDEVELVGRYSILQRGRSYAELARWMGLIDDGFLGVGAVLAITLEFKILVLGERGDRDNVSPKLRSKDTPEYALLGARAEAGIQAIESRYLTLEPPSETSLRHTYDRLLEVHAGAYNWDPPDVWDADGAAGGAGTTSSLRNYVRGWITRWDLARLYPGQRVALQREELHIDYGEDADLEAAPEDNESAHTAKE